MYNAESQVFITNLAKYNAGELVGEWFTLSEGHEALSNVLKKVLGNDEEYFITDYQADFEISEYDNLQELVTFAMLFDSLETIEKVAVIYWLDFMGLDRQEVLEMMQNDTIFDNCTVYEAENEKELGEAIAECMDIPEHLRYYIDYERIGHDEVCNGATQVGDYYVVSY